MWIRGARPTGMLPSKRTRAKTLRGPIASHRGPEMSRIRRVAERETMLELATWVLVRERSSLIVTVS